MTLRPDMWLWHQEHVFGPVSRSHLLWLCEIPACSWILKPIVHGSVMRYLYVSSDL